MPRLSAGPYSIWHPTVGLARRIRNMARMAEMSEIPLRMKYRNLNSRDWTGKTKNTKDPDGGTKVWMAERNKPNPGAAGNGRAGQFGAGYVKKTSRKQGNGIRRRSYGPW